MNRRIIACYAAILGTFPYLTLKVAWLTGGTLGLTEPSFVDSPVLRLANVVTAGMDAVAILLAFALTYPWGRRLPAPLVLLPAWVATGLLGPIVLVSPVIGADLLAPPSGELPMRIWVWAVVYGGFAWQGAALLTAFVFYARDRWPSLTRGSFAGRPSWVAWPALGTALVHLAWAAGSTFAQAPGHTTTVAGRTMDAVFGLLILLAVLASSTTGPRWPRVVAVWTGAGAMFGWGAWLLFTTLTGGPLSVGATGPQALVYGVQAGTAVVLLRRLTYAGSRLETDAAAAPAR